MKGNIILFVGIIVLGVTGYIVLSAVNDHIDRKSGSIVEKTLSDNTISQLIILSEIELQIEEGDLKGAREKLSESISTLRYILESNCNSEKCEKVLDSYKGK